MEFADGKELAPNDLRPMHKLWLVAGSTLSLVGRYSNLMVFRTFSKAYGLAGLRCGYAVGALGLVRQLGKALLPYHVNAFTLMAAKTVYENKELYKERIKTIREERDKFADCLKALGFKVWPTATNFVTFRAEGELMQQLAKAYAAKFTERLPEQAAGGKLIFKYLWPTVFWCVISARIRCCRAACVSPSAYLKKTSRLLLKSPSCVRR